MEDRFVLAGAVVEEYLNMGLLITDFLISQVQTVICACVK